MSLRPKPHVGRTVACGDRSVGYGFSANQKLHGFLRTRVYDARPLPELAKQGAIWAGVFLVFGLVVAVPQDGKAQRMYPEGRIVRGPVMATRDVFNRKRQRKRRSSITNPPLARPAPAAAGFSASGTDYC